MPNISPPEVASPLELQRRRVREALAKYERELLALQQMEGLRRREAGSGAALLPKDPCCAKAVRVQCTCGEAIECEEHGRACRGQFSHD